MKETPRRKRQLAAWVRWKHDHANIHLAPYRTDDVVRIDRHTLAAIFRADAHQSTRKAAAHLLRAYRGVRGYGVTRYLRDIGFLADDDAGWNALFADLKLENSELMAGVYADLTMTASPTQCTFARKLMEAIDAFETSAAAQLTNLILVERAERLERKMAARIPPDGMRVQLPPNGSIDRYGHFLLQGDLTGTVVHHGPGEFVVKVDQHFAELDEWENEVSYVDTVEHFWDEWVPLKETA